MEISSSHPNMCKHKCKDKRSCRHVCCKRADDKKLDVSFEGAKKAVKEGDLEGLRTILNQDPRALHPNSYETSLLYDAHDVACDSWTKTRLDIFLELLHRGCDPNFKRPQYGGDDPESNDAYDVVDDDVPQVALRWLGLYGAWPEWFPPMTPQIDRHGKPKYWTDESKLEKRQILITAWSCWTPSTHVDFPLPFRDMVFVLLLSLRGNCRPLYHVRYHLIPFYARVFIEGLLRVKERREKWHPGSNWLRKTNGSEPCEANTQSEDVAPGEDMVPVQGMTEKFMRWADWFFG